MRRGEIWSAAGGPDYAGKPRPVLIIQSDDFDATLSITICAFTSRENPMALARVDVEPTATNGLRSHSQLMVDKITTLPRAKLGRRIGKLAEDDVLRMNRALMVFLGLAE